MKRIEIDINKVINKKDKGKVSVSVTQIKEQTFFRLFI